MTDPKRGKQAVGSVQMPDFHSKANMVTAFVSPSPVVALLSIVVASASLPHSPESPVASDRARVPEAQRIRAHFDSVVSELPSHGLPAFSPAQQARRAAVFAILRAYRDAGNFPHNYDSADQPTPYLVDRKTGVSCAVAFLLESTGRRDIVDRVAAANNNIFVAELAGDAALATWLDENGLTLREAARIQVPYFGDPMPDRLNSKWRAHNAKRERQYWQCKRRRADSVGPASDVDAGGWCGVWRSRPDDVQSQHIPESASVVQ